MILLAIDPSYAGDTGWALWNQKKLIEYGHLPPASVSDTLTRFSLIKRADVLVIEDQFFSKNADVLKKLVLSRAWWEVPARDVFGLEIDIMAPQTWQKAVNRGWAFGSKSKTNYEVYENYVRARYEINGSTSLVPDTIAALCIGSVWMDLHPERLVKP